MKLLKTIFGNWFWTLLLLLGMAFVFAIIYDLPLNTAWAGYVSVGFFGVAICWGIYGLILSLIYRAKDK